MFVGCLSFQKIPSNFSPEVKGKFLALEGDQPWQIHYRETGRPGNPAILFLHGYGSASVVWIQLMDELARLGYHCIAPDIPGFGLSDKYRGDYKTTTIARRMTAFLRQKGIEQTDLIAHSWGSSVALAMRIISPQRVRRIVINSGWVYSTQIVPVIRWAKVPVIGEMIYGLFYREQPGDKFALSVYDPERFVTQALVAKINESLNRPGAIAAALAIARGMDLVSFERQYSAIRNPTLLIWGHQDRVALPFYGRRLAAELSNSRLEFLDRCGHLPMLERPHLVQKLVSDFLGPAVK